MTGAQLRVDRRPGGPTVVTVTGEVDLSNAAGFARDLDDAAADTTRLVLDLSALEYLDSQGVRVLHRLAARHAGGALALTIVASPGSIAADLLAVTRLGDVVPVVGTRLDAPA